MPIAVLRRGVPVGVAFVSIAAYAAGIPWLNRDASKDRTDSRDLAFTAFVPAENADAVAWANPLDGRAIRTLLVAPRFTLADARHLSAQLELELGIVAYWDSNRLGRPEDARLVPGTDADETLARLHRQLDRELDVIAIANVDLAQLPQEDFTRIIERVHEGTGLVLAHHRKTTARHLQSFYDALEPEDGGPVLRGVGHQLAPEWANGLGFVQTSRYGQGRVVELDFPGPRPETHCLIPALTLGVQAEWEHYDTYLSLAVRAIRWAARRDPKTAIVRVEPEHVPAPNVTEVPAGLDLAVEGDALDLIRRQMIRPFVVHLDAPAPKGYSIRTRVRRPGLGTPVITDPRTSILREGDTTARVYLVGGSGIYYLDVWLLNRGGVVDWYTEAVLVEAWPVINNLTLNRTTVDAQSTLGLSFTMPPRPRPASVQIRATDPLGRVVAKSFIPVAPSTGLVQAGLDLEDLIAGPIKVEIFAVDRESETFSEWDRTQAAYAYRFVPIRGAGTERRLDIVVPLAGSAEYNARNAYQTLRQAGVDRASTEGAQESVGFLAESGLNPIARVAQYTPDRILNGAVREPCLTDPDWLHVEMDRLRAASEMVRLAGASRLSVGNGNCLTEGDEPVCQSASAVDAYSQYLRKIYGPSGTSSAVQTTSVNMNAFDQWIDFRSFMDTVFTDFHADARTHLAQIDHRPRTGFVLRPHAGAFTGYDLSKLAAAQDWLTLPNEPLAVEKLRSYAAKDFVAGLSIPGVLDDRDPPRDRWYPWYAVLHGIGELWLPPVLSTSEEVVTSPLAGPDGTQVSQAPELFDEARVVSSGFARVLYEGQRAASGIAVYDSRASYYLNCIEPSFGCDSSLAELRFIELVRRLGYQFDFVSSHEVANGALATYKVLLMPMVRAMSDAEVEAVRAFHASGGCLIADLAPGAYNEHGVPRTTPPLDAQFGVRHIERQTAGAPADALVQIDVRGARTSGSFLGLIPDLGLDSDSATVGGIAGVSPVWLINESTGLTALANHPLPDAGESATALASLLDAVLGAGGAVRPAIVEGEGGNRFRGEVFSYDLDGNSLVTILADPEAPKQRLRISFAGGVSAYDALQARRISRPKEFAATLDGGDAALFGVLPYDVTGITLETLPSVVAGTRLPFTLGVNVRKGDPSTHVVHVELISLQTGATGPIPYYSRDVVCRGGQGEGFIRLALNERSGVYKLAARDVLTGVSAETVVNVLEP